MTIDEEALVSYSKARDASLKLYYTGKKCPHGHLAKKRVRDKRCVQCHKIDKSKYKKSEAWKRQSRERAKRYRKKEENKYKIYVRKLVIKAIKIGELSRMPCEKCGSTYRIHAHHDDYSKPLDVKWLCTKHHHDRHEELKAKGIIL